MKILWIIFDSISQIENGRHTSNTASIRYRVISPLEYLAGQGQDVSAMLVNTDKIQLSQDILDGLDVVVFSKSFHAVNEKLMGFFKERGVRTVFDVCDPHFIHPQLGQHYKNLAVAADTVTVNTAAMQQMVQDQCGLPSIIIPDPVLSPQGQAAFQPGVTVKLLWFGHPSNLDSLEAVLPNIMTLKQVEMHICTKLNDTMHAFFKQKAREDFRFTLHDWSLQTQQQLIEATDLVVIPSLDSDKKKTKSSNRLVEPLYSGRMVVAQPMPGYDAFAEYAWIGQSLAEGVAWCLKNEADVVKRIASGQVFIERQLSPEHVGHAWMEALAK